MSFAILAYLIPPNEFWYMVQVGNFYMTPFCLQYQEHQSLILKLIMAIMLGFPGGLDGKESACNVGDPDSIPVSGRYPGEGMATHSSILAWKTPWTEEPGRLQSIGLQSVGHD